MFQYHHSMEQERTGNESATNLLPPWNLSLIDKPYMYWQPIFYTEFKCKYGSEKFLGF